MRWTPKRTLPIVKPSLEHRYKQREIKTGRSTGKGGGSARSRLPFGFAQQRRTTLRKDPLLPQRLSDGSSGSSSDRRHRYGEVRNNEQTKKTDRLVPVRNSVAATLSGGLLGSFSRSRLRAGSCSARIAFQRVGTINALCGNELGSSLGSLFCSSRFVRIACTRYHRGSSSHNDKCINLFHGNKEIKMVIAANISNRSK